MHYKYGLHICLFKLLFINMFFNATKYMLQHQSISRRGTEKTQVLVGLSFDATCITLRLPCNYLRTKKSQL